MTGQEWVSASRLYVSPQGQGDAWATEAAAAGKRGTQRIVHAGETTAPLHVAELLGFSSDTCVPVVERRRVMYLDDQPFELTDTYYPADIAAGTALAQPRKIAGGAVALLGELGHRGRRVVEEVSARHPSEDEREMFSLEAFAPMLVLTRVTYDSDDRPIQVDVMVNPAHLQRHRYETSIG